MNFLIQFTVLLGLVLLAYRLLFARDRRFRFNRAFLWLGLLLSFLVPFLETDLLRVDPVMPVNTFELSVDHLSVASPAFTGQTKTKGVPVSGNSGFTLVAAGFLLYLAIVLVMFIRFVFNLLRMRKLSKSAITEYINDQKIYRVASHNQSFSFFNKIFIPLSQNPDPFVLAHERVHIKEMHSADVLVVEILLVFFWFHPLLWLFSREIRLNHEFTADYHAAGKDYTAYCHRLLNQFRSEPAASLSSSFNYLSLKHRIQMIHNKKKTGKSFVKNLALSLTVIGTTALLFSCMNSGEESGITTLQNELPTVVIDAGHGGVDTGATGVNGHTESELLLMLVEEIKETGSEKINLKFTRTADQLLTQKNRILFASEHDADLLISLHLATGHLGFSGGKAIFISRSSENRDYEISKEKYEEKLNTVNMLTKEVGLTSLFHDLPVKNAGFKILKDADSPAFMYMAGSINDPAEVEEITDPEKRKALAKNIIRSLEQLVVR